MTDELDPLIASAFAESAPSLDGEEFTAAVVKRARFAKVRVVAPWMVLGFASVVVVWALALPFETAQIITRILTTAVVDLGEGWLAWAISPVNSIAAVLAAGWKMIRVVRKKLIAISYDR